MPTRRTRRAGARNPDVTLSGQGSLHSLEFPDGVRPSPHPGGGFIFEHEHGGSWRATVDELRSVIANHARYRRKQAEAA